MEQMLQTVTRTSGFKIFEIWHRYPPHVLLLGASPCIPPPFVSIPFSPTHPDYKQNQIYGYRVTPVHFSLHTDLPRWF